jgi:hypothetical protein
VIPKTNDSDFFHNSKRHNNPRKKSSSPIGATTRAKNNILKNSTFNPNELRTISRLFCSGNSIPKTFAVASVKRQTKSVTNVIIGHAFRVAFIALTITR